ncbi:unnamed protein product [Urochloa humidicola]
MEGTRPQPPTGGDRLSKLEDRVLGHILSFLPANEAARAALLSSRWRDVFAAVHTVSLEEPEPPLQEQDNNLGYSDRGAPPYDPDAPPPFHCAAVSNALLARNDGRRGAAAPLRALRVVMEMGDGGARSSSAPTVVDQWVKYAVHNAAARDGGDGGLRIDLRFRRVPLCDRRPYALLQRSGGQKLDGVSAADVAAESPPRARHRRRRMLPCSDVGSSDWSEDESDNEEHPPQRQRSISSNEGSPDSEPCPQRQGAESTESGNYAGGRALSPRQPSATSSRQRSPSPSLSSSSDDDVAACDEEAARPNHYRFWGVQLTVPTVLFSCAALRSLSLGHLWLAPPDKVNLPSLETLLLSHTSDHGEFVEQIIAGSPRLADLTLEACRGVARLHVPTGARLRRLALRCCHSLAAVVLDASELVAFEYRGAVPDSGKFLTMNVDCGGSPKVAYCKVDICGQEVCSVKEVTKLARLLQLFPNAKRLHLESARLGSGIDSDVLMVFPNLLGLRHLELRGRLPDDDTVVVDAVSRILEHTPSLEALSLIFHPEPHDRWAGDSYISEYNEEELLDAHRLKYNGQSVLDALSSSTIPCLRTTVKDINLVHYQGGRAQRALAKFLLCNAPVIQKLWCEFAEGPLWTHTQMMREIKSWVINKSASTHFL